MDRDSPVYRMGRAAEFIGVTPAFLRSLDEAGLIEPERSHGGHRRYSRHQLDLAVRVRQLLDDGFPLAAACRVVTLEDRLAAAHERITRLGGRLGPGEDATIPTQTRRDLGATRYYPGTEPGECAPDRLKTAGTCDRRRGAPRTG